MDVVSTTKLVDLVSQIRRQTDRRTRVSVVQSSHSISLSNDRRQISRELFEIQLLLIARLYDGFVRLRVGNQSVNLSEERVDRLGVLQNANQ